ncbi:response regulator transcription factor [Paenibacillus shenyangensis]|uniref:response regulator transcription factor n=1 Tax=Paenibacillus sp. A9 TaxID=1284352 RepID=UPI0003814D23|nr:response regulator transcription factor [Paenibacillus sp. A9]
MIKVVIVDDEPKLRLGLQTLIPWKELGFEVIAAAANGEEALKVMEQERPDMAIVDIRMPLMDGLQLLECMSSCGYKLHVIILSGYADFEYAKQAIKYGVAGYLLKPVDTREMTQMLQGIREQIEEQQRQYEEDRITTADRDWLLQRLLVPRNIGEDAAALHSTARAAGIVWDSYEIVALLPKGAEDDGSGKVHSFRESLKSRIEHTGRGTVTVYFPYVVLFLQNPLRGRKQQAELYQLLHNTLGSCHFIAATGGAVSTVEEISRSFLHAQSSLKHAFFSKKGQLLRHNASRCPLPDNPYAQDSSPEEIMEELILQLYYSLDTGNQSMVRPLLENGLSFFLAQQYDERYIKESFFHLINAIVHKLTNGFPATRRETEQISQFMKGIFAYEHLEDLLDETHSFLLALAQHAEPEGKEKELKIMIHIIHRHYSDPLRLETLAGMLNYSTAYLGQIFKNKTGEYFNTYLDKVRIQKAKELLQQGMKVYEVSEQVGYTSVNYFHGKFKKYEGCSPSDFKNP